MLNFDAFVLRNKLTVPETMGTTNRSFSAMFVASSLMMLTLVNSTSIDTVKELRASLLNGYDKYVRPVKNQTHVVNVRLGLSIMALQELDEVNEKFSFVGVLRVQWTDENLVWDLSNYSGVNELVMGYREVWLPEIVLTNPSEKMDSFGDDWQLIRYTADGRARWNPGTIIKATCSINAYYFPFDIQQCHVEVYTWGYAYYEVQLYTPRDEIDIRGMVEHGSWSVVKTQAKCENEGITSTGYFIIWFERKPEYVIVNIILPMLALCLLNVLVFVLPAESGERVSYSITILLSIAVFMTIVSDTLPRTSRPLPLISYFLMTSLIESAVIALATTLNLRLYYKKSDKDIPGCLVRICQCIKRCGSSSRREFKERCPATEESFESSLKSLKLESTDKVRVIDTQMQGSVVSFYNEPDVSWQDVSYLVDGMLFIISMSFTLAMFSYFMIVTKTASKGL